MENYTPETQTPETQTPEPQTKTADTEQVVGRGAFFGLELLLSLPLIGFICSIIFSVAPQNRSLRHYAQAKLIWAIINLLLTILLIVGVCALFAAIPEMISQELGIEVEELQDIAGQLENVPALIEQIGGLDAAADLIGQAGELGEIGELIGQIENIENLDEVLGQLENTENIEAIIGQLEGIENIDELEASLEDPAVLAQLLEAFLNSGN